jgi:glutamate-1-semialdehyde aminotransferase
MLPIISSDMFSSILFSSLTTMISGVGTLKELDSDAISELNLLGDRLRERLQQIGDDSNQQIMIAGKGSLFQIHFTNDSV